MAELREISIALTAEQIAALEAELRSGDYATTSEILSEAIADWQAKRDRQRREAAANRTIAALLAVDSVTSAGGREIVAGLSPGERGAAMFLLIAELRRRNWVEPVAGIHGAVILAKASQEAAAELKRFLAGVSRADMPKAIWFMLRQAGMLGA